MLKVSRVCAARSASLAPACCVAGNLSHPHHLGKRTFKLGIGSEWTKEQRFAIDWKRQQGGKPMDFDNPLTWIGLIAPMFGTAYSIYMVNKIYLERSAEEEQKEKEVIRAITHRDPKLKIDDL